MKKTDITTLFPDAAFMPVNFVLYFVPIKEALMFPVFGVIKEASEIN